MNYLMFLDGFNSSNPCSGVSNLVGVAKIIVGLIQVIVPIALIIWGSIDMLKAIIAGDDKKIAAARKPLIQRFISAIIVFLIPWIFNAIMGLVASGDSAKQWIKCYNDASFDGSTINTDIDNLGK